MTTHCTISWTMISVKQLFFQCSWLWKTRPSLKMVLLLVPTWKLSVYFFSTRFSISSHNCPFTSLVILAIVLFNCFLIVFLSLLMTFGSKHTLSVPISLHSPFSLSVVPSFCNFGLFLSVLNSLLSQDSYTMILHSLL